MNIKIDWLLKTVLFLCVLLIGNIFLAQPASAELRKPLQGAALKNGLTPEQHARAMYFMALKTQILQSGSADATAAIQQVESINEFVHDTLDFLADPSSILDNNDFIAGQREELAKAVIKIVQDNAYLPVNKYMLEKVGPDKAAFIFMLTGTIVLHLNETIPILKEDSIVQQYVNAVIAKNFPLITSTFAQLLNHPNPWVRMIVNSAISLSEIIIENTPDETKSDFLSEVNDFHFWSGIKNAALSKQKVPIAKIISGAISITTDLVGAYIAADISSEQKTTAIALEFLSYYLVTYGGDLNAFKTDMFANGSTTIAQLFNIFGAQQASLSQSMEQFYGAVDWQDFIPGFNNMADKTAAVVLIRKIMRETGSLAFRFSFEGASGLPYIGAGDTTAQLTLIPDPLLLMDYDFEAAMVVEHRLNGNTQNHPIPSSGGAITLADTGMGSHKFDISYGFQEKGTLVRTAYTFTYTGEVLVPADSLSFKPLIITPTVSSDSHGYSLSMTLALPVDAVTYSRPATATNAAVSGTLPLGSTPNLRVRFVDLNGSTANVSKWFSFTSGNPTVTMPLFGTDALAVKSGTLAQYLVEIELAHPNVYGVGTYSYSKLVNYSDLVSNTITPYLEIQVSSAVRATSMSAAALKLTPSDTVRLYPRNTPGWPDFKALTGVVSVWLNDANGITYQILGTLLEDGGVEFKISGAMPTATTYQVKGISSAGGVAPEFSVQQLVEIDSFFGGAIIIEDQFDGTVLNSSIWSANGYSVSVHDGYLDLAANVTDNVGYVSTTFSPESRIKVEMRHMMHTVPRYDNYYGNYFYYPNVSFSGQDSAKGFQVQWQRSDYGPDYCNTPAYNNKILIGNTGSDACNATHSNLLSSDFYDRWVTSIIEYDSSTGLITLDADGDGAVDFSAVQTSEHRGPIQAIGISPYGWWTGHFHKIDYIKVTSGSLVNASPSPVAIFLSENLPDGIYQVGPSTKSWRFKSGASAIVGLKAVQVSVDGGLGITQTEITIGEIPASSEFLVQLPINPVHDATNFKSAYWKFVDGSGQAVPITNSKSGQFWLKVSTNKAPAFSLLQLVSVAGKENQQVCLPLQVTDADGDSLSYNVTAGGGSVINGTCMGKFGPTYVNTFGTPGIIPVTVQANDGHGGTADTSFQAVITSDSSLKDFYNDVTYANAITQAQKDQYNAIHYLTLNGITIGSPVDPNDPSDLARNFKPDTNASQAEALAMVMKSANVRGGLELDAELRWLPNLVISDVANGIFQNYSWAIPYVLKAEALGMIPGAESFNPAAPAKREWLATLVARMMALNTPMDVISPAEYVFEDQSSFSTTSAYDAARTTAFFGYMGSGLGSNFNFYPQDYMIRADVAMVAAKILRSPTIDGISTSMVAGTLYDKQLPTVEHRLSFTVNSATNLTANRMLGDGTGNIKADDLFTPDTYTKAYIVRPGYGYSVAPTIAGLTATAVSVPTSLPDITKSEIRNLVVLLESTDFENRNPVRGIYRMDYGVIFPDADGDGVRDSLDLWSTNPLFSNDANGNGIPDNADTLWGLAGRTGGSTVIINGQGMTLINAILDNTLSNDKTAPTTSVAIIDSMSPLTVTLLSNETGMIHYTTDGSTPTTASATYSSPLSLPSGTKLSFFATDLAGNCEATRTVTIQGSGDTNPPVFNSLTAPSYSNSFLVPVAIDATDDIAITDWCLNESGSSSTCLWSTNKPTTFTFAGQGIRTLYAFAKDAADNIGSVSKSVEVIIPDQTLTVILAGTGGGTITNDPAGTPGIPCTSGSCSTTYTYNTAVSLLHTPNAISTFGGWTGCGSIGPDEECNVTMTSAKSVTATFILASKAMIDSIGYSSLADAYSGATSAVGVTTTIFALDAYLGEVLNMAAGKNIILKGGYKADYMTKGGTPTTLKGPLKISSGSLRVEGVAVK